MPRKHWLQAHAGQSARAGNRGLAGAAYALFQAASPREKIVAGGHDERDYAAKKFLSFRFFARSFARLRASAMSCGAMRRAWNRGIRAHQ